MTSKDVHAVVEALKPIEDRLRDELLRDVERKMETYRRSITVRDKWCCQTIQAFAAEVWGVSQPRTEGPDPVSGLGGWFGSTSFKLRGKDVIYCPFCGVKL